MIEKKDIGKLHKDATKGNLAKKIDKRVIWWSNWNINHDISCRELRLQKVGLLDYRFYGVGQR